MGTTLRSSRRSYFPPFRSHFIRIAFVGAALANPVVDLLLAKFPETAYLMSGHVSPVDPLVDRVPFDTEVTRDLLHGQPTIFCRSFRFHTVIAAPARRGRIKLDDLRVTSLDVHSVMTKASLSYYVQQEWARDRRTLRLRGCGKGRAWSVRCRPRSWPSCACRRRRSPCHRRPTGSRAVYERGSLRPAGLRDLRNGRSRRPGRGLPSRASCRRFGVSVRRTTGGVAAAGSAGTCRRNQLAGVQAGEAQRSGRSWSSWLMGVAGRRVSTSRR